MDTKSGAIMIRYKSDFFGRGAFCILLINHKHLKTVTGIGESNFYGGDHGKEARALVSWFSKMLCAPWASTVHSDMKCSPRKCATWENALPAHAVFKWPAVIQFIYLGIFGEDLLILSPGRSTYCLLKVCWWKSNATRSHPYAAHPPPPIHCYWSDFQIF